MWKSLPCLLFGQRLEEKDVSVTRTIEARNKTGRGGGKVKVPLDI